MEKAMIFYVNECKDEKCMETECKFLKTYYQKASAIIQNNMVKPFSENILAIIRIPERLKTKEKQENQELIVQRLSKAGERLQFAQNNYSKRFSSLATFTKITCYFQFYNIDSRTCTCNTFANRKICKHELVADLLSGKKNPYEQKIGKGSK